MSYVVDWRSNVSSKTQRRDPVKDRGMQLWPGLGNRGAPAACVSKDARDWTLSELVYVHVLRVRRRVGRIGVLYHLLLVPTIVGPGVRLCWIALPPDSEACAVYQYQIMHSEILKILDSTRLRRQRLGVQLGLGLENRGEPTACVHNDTRNWTHFVLVYVHVLRVRRRVGCIGGL